MKYKVHSFRFGLEIIESQESLKKLWEEIKKVLNETTEEELIQHFEERVKKDASTKSISHDINAAFKKKFIALGWKSESYIFKNQDYCEKDTWRLDFAKEDISLEVAFNHSSVVAWNLLKPVLASELNHIEKEIQTKIGVIICATNKMKVAGGFDNAIGSYERYLEYLPPLQSILSTPMVIIGLENPVTFKVTHEKNDKGKNIGKIVRL